MTAQEPRERPVTPYRPETRDDRQLYGLRVLMENQREVWLNPVESTGLALAVTVASAVVGGLFLLPEYDGVAVRNVAVAVLFFVLAAVAFCWFVWTVVRGARRSRRRRRLLPADYEAPSVWRRKKD